MRYEVTTLLEGARLETLAVEANDARERASSPRAAATPCSSEALMPRIGTHNASTTLRLADGETQVLMGLIRDDDRQSAAKVPGSKALR